MLQFFDLELFYAGVSQPKRPGNGGLAMGHAAPTRILPRPGAGSRPMRLLVASPHELNLRGLVSVLSDKYPDGTIEPYSSVDDLLAAAASAGDATAVILDSADETESLYLVVGKIARHYPQTIIVLLAPKISDREMYKLFERGVSAFLHGDMSASSFGSAMDLVLSGEKFVPYSIMRRAHSDGQGGDVQDHVPGLSARQQEILTLIAKGYSNKMIAAELGIKEVTVAFHIRAVFAKLGVSSRTQAVAAARGIGFKLP